MFCVSISEYTEEVGRASYDHAITAIDQGIAFNGLSYDM